MSTVICMDLDLNIYQVPSRWWPISSSM